MKTKKILATMVALALSVVTTYADNFALTDVKVDDKDTLNVTFNKELLSDTSLFDFLLTLKSDDTTEVSLSWAVLDTPTSLKLKLNQDLAPNTEYNLVVVFVSDKDWVTIENWVDAMVTFTTPATFASDISSNWELNVDSNEMVSNEVNSSDELNAAWNEDMVSTTSTEVSSSWVAVPAEVLADTTDKLPQTWPKEILVVILALLLWVGAMFIRRKA